MYSIMYNMNKNFMLKQAALFILCGLLNASAYSQVRSKEDIALTVKKFCKESFNRKAEEFDLKSNSSMLLKEEKYKKFTAFYLYSSKTENGGFIIASADKRMPAILAYSDKGNFDVENIPTNVTYWLSCYAEFYKQLNMNTFMQGVQSLELNTDEIFPLLGEIQWGQDVPYNNLCPTKGRTKTLTGCVATGMAQIMKYYEYPEVASGIIQYVTNTNRIHINEDLSKRRFDWDNMQSNYSKSYSQMQADAIAQLMYCCGVSVNMDYDVESEGGSGAYQYSLVKAYVHNFGYDKDATYLMRNQCSTKDWHQIMINELKNGRPINYAGQSLSSGGHSFVIDGYRISEENSYPDYHINWGWDGQCDGYYQIVDLAPTEGGLQGTTDGFNVSQEMVIGIQPEDGISQSGSYIVASDIQLPSSSVKIGKSATLTIGSCINMSYQPFDGVLNVMLRSTVDSTEYLIGTKKQISMVFLDEHTGLDIKMNIPDSIPEGEYEIVLCSMDTISSFASKLLVKNPLIINLLKKTEDKENTEDENSFILGCSELELRKNKDSLQIQINLYELLNLSEDIFTGYIKLLLSDNQSNIIKAFGDSILLEEMNYKDVLGDHKTLKGCLIGEFTDGEYRLYVGARRLDERVYRYICQYDWTKPDIFAKELYLEVKIENGIIHINDNEYKVVPQFIQTMCAKDIDDFLDIYTISGTFVGRMKISEFQNMPSGIYIFRNRNSVKKIIR